MNRSNITFNYSSLHKNTSNQRVMPEIVFNTRPFSSLTPIERYKWRQREKKRKEKEILIKQEHERLRIEKAKKDEEIFRRNRESMTNYKLPSVDLLFPCLLSKAVKIPITVLIHFCSCRPTFKGRRTYLAERRKDYVRMSTLIKRPFFQCEIQTLIQWFELEKKHRLSFKKLMNHWLYKHYKDRKLNTEDPVTFQIPENPIHVFDVNRRGMYVFEASCLKKHIETELLYSEWLFPEPKHPKNPLTNIEFTECQRLKILKDLREKGYGSWIFETYRSLRWNLKDIQQQYQIPIKLAALGDLIRNPSSDDTIEYLQEFIEEQYDYHNILQTPIRPSLKVLYWIVEHYSTSSYIKQWIKAFEEYYKLTIVHGLNDLGREVSIAFNKIYKKTKLLLTNYEEYNNFKNKYMEAHKHEIPNAIVLPSVAERLAAVQEAQRQLIVRHQSQVPRQENPQQGLENHIVVQLASGDIRLIVPNRLFSLHNSH